MMRKCTRVTRGKCALWGNSLVRLTLRERGQISGAPTVQEIHGIYSEKHGTRYLKTAVFAFS